MSQLDLFSFTAPTSYPYTTPAPAPRPAPPVQVDDDPDDESPAIVGSLSAGQLAQVAYQNTCRLSLIGSTDFCHNCALFVSATRSSSGSVSVTCKAYQYVDDHGQLLEGYGLIPGCVGRDIQTRPQWVKEVYLPGSIIRERRPREVQYKA